MVRAITTILLSRGEFQVQTKCRSDGQQLLVDPGRAIPTSILLIHMDVASSVHDLLLGCCKQLYSKVYIKYGQLLLLWYMVRVH